LRKEAKTSTITVAVTDIFAITLCHCKYSLVEEALGGLYYKHITIVKDNHK